MKIRHGFVSNSSSSSFIVQFPDNIDKTDINSIHDCMFPDGLIIINKMTSMKIAEYVMQDLKHQQPISKRSMLRNRTFCLSNEEVKQLYDELHEGSVFYSFHYGDEGNDGTLEHGQIFRNLLSYRISHH